MRHLVFWSVFILLALNIILWGGLSLFAPFGRIMGMPHLAIFVFNLHIAAYLAWLYFKVMRPATEET